MRRLALTLALCAGGCLGPLLPLPPARGAHLVRCREVTCNQLGLADPLRPTLYDATRRLCLCHFLDARGLPDYAEVDPHAH